MKKDWPAAFFASFSIILDLIVSPIRTFIWEEQEVLNGGEYDPEADYEQGTQEENSTDQL